MRRQRRLQVAAVPTCPLELVIVSRPLRALRAHKKPLQFSPEKPAESPAPAKTPRAVVSRGWRGPLA